MKARVVYNRLLRGWYIVRGPHQAPLGGRFESREAALAHLRGVRNIDGYNPEFLGAKPAKAGQDY